MAAKKVAKCKTGNYHIFDLSSGRVDKAAVSSKRGAYLGKLRSNFKRTRHYMYARGPGGAVDKREAGVVVFDKPNLSAFGKAKEPRRMTVVLPSVDAATRVPQAQRVAGKGTGLHNAPKGENENGIDLYGDGGGVGEDGPDELFERLETIDNWRAWQARFPDEAARQAAETAKAKRKLDFHGKQGAGQVHMLDGSPARSDASEGKEADGGGGGGGGEGGGGDVAASAAASKGGNPLKLGKFTPYKPDGDDDEEAVGSLANMDVDKKFPRKEMDARQKRVNGIAVLANAKPKRNRKGQYELKFKGRRGTKGFVESVKNVQLVADGERSSVCFDPQNGVLPLPCDGEGTGPILLQFGKVGRDRFVLDFRAPLSPFQAFCIALSQFAY